MRYTGGPAVVRPVPYDRDPRFEGDIWVVDGQTYLLAGGRVIRIGDRKIV